jgi:putative membrane protein
MRHLILALGLTAALLAGGAAYAQDKGDPKFIAEAIEGNLAEVAMGKLAQQNGQSDGVKSFGGMLVADHSANNTKATAVAQALNMTPPAEPNKKQKKDYEKMAKLSGAKFDKAFAAHMVKDHKDDIKKFEKAAKSKNAQVAQYAGETLPTLRKHLEAAQALTKGGAKMSLRGTR